jgi:hypothetical protein
MTISSPSHEAMWAERVRAWRSSGETAVAFAEANGFTHSALRYWTKRLARPRKTASAPPIVALVRKPAVSTSTTTTVRAEEPELVVEVANARVRVGRGFDPALLGEVVRALGGAR